MAKPKFILSGTTDQRPTVTTVGFEFFDTDLNRPIWWNGSSWSTNALTPSTPVSNITAPTVTTIEEANTAIQALVSKINQLLQAERDSGQMST